LGCVLKRLALTESSPKRIKQATKSNKTAYMAQIILSDYLPDNYPAWYFQNIPIAAQALPSPSK